MDARLEMPVLVKEMRAGMRGYRMPLLLFVTSAISVAICLFILLARWRTSYAFHSFAALGHYLFTTLIVTQAVLCGLVAPALTAGSIAGEVERQCLEMLQLSRLSMMNIAVSKLLSALGVLLLMLVCTMPVVAITFLLGGVSLGQVLLAYALVLAIGLYGGAVGLYYSARLRKTASALMLAYPVVLLWCIGVPLIGYGISSLNISWPLAIDRDTLIYPGINLLDMLFPTLLIAAIFSACTRRTLRWWVTLLIWLVLSSLLCSWYALDSPAFIRGVIFTVIGSPAMAIQVQLLNPFQAAGIPGTWGKWCAAHLIELTLPILVTLAWAYLIFTAQRLRELRQPTR